MNTRVHTLSLSLSHSHTLLLTYILSLSGFRPHIVQQPLSNTLTLSLFLSILSWLLSSFFFFLPLSRPYSLFLLIPLNCPSFPPSFSLFVPTSLLRFTNPFPRIRYLPFYLGIKDLKSSSSQIQPFVNLKYHLRIEVNP